MAGLVDCTKKLPRGRAFPKGVSGNPGGRPKRTPEELDLIKACKARTPDALAIIEDLMENSKNEKVRLSAAQYVIERGWGRAPERIELETKNIVEISRKMDPHEAYMLMLKGGAVLEAETEITPEPETSAKTPLVSAQMIEEYVTSCAQDLETRCPQQKDGRLPAAGLARPDYLDHDPEPTVG